MRTPRNRFFAIHVCCLLAMSLLPSLACTQPPEEMEKLPALEDLETPSVKQLMTEPPRDWILLNTNEVLIVESVAPRPQTLEKRLAEIEEKKELRARAQGAEKEQLSEELKDLQSLAVVLPGTGEGAGEFNLPIRRIRGFIHHEDHMLRRIELLLDEEEIDQPLEILDRLRKTWADWPGMDEMHQRILFVDAKKRVAAKNYESSLMLIDELFRRNPKYPQLPNIAGSAIQPLVQDALDRENTLRAQFFLNRLRQQFPEHEVYTRYAQQLNARVAGLLAKAESESVAKNYRAAAELAEQAASVWPKADQLRGPHRTHTERYQRLHVGLLDQPETSIAYWVGDEADLRQSRLTRLPLFEIDRIRDGTAYYRTRFFDEWEPLDLGRQMRFTLKQFRQPYEIQNTVSTVDIVAPILERLDPESEQYDERLSAYVDSVVIDSPIEFTLIFKRVPPRIEPLLSSVIVGDVAFPEKAFGTLTPPGGFNKLEQTRDRVVYQRSLPETDGLPKYHIAEIVEHRFETYEKAVQALHRGNISMLPNLPDWIIRRMQEDEEFVKRYFIQPYMVPVTHLLQFNPESETLKNRELRKALAYAVDRERILKDIILHDEKSRHGRLVTAPFLSSSPGRNVLVRPRRFDLSAGVAMSLAARRQLESGIPELVMISAPGPIPLEATTDIAKTWERIGFKVRVVQAHEPRPAKWDIMYRTTQMAEPLVEIWPFLTMSDRARLTDLDLYPDWLKQEMVGLDRISDQSRAIAALQNLHSHLDSDASIVPLYEVDRYLVFRKNIQGFPARPLHCYDGIGRWSIDAWYQTELP